MAKVQTEQATRTIAVLQDEIKQTQGQLDAAKKHVSTLEEILLRQQSALDMIQGKTPIKHVKFHQTQEAKDRIAAAKRAYWANKRKAAVQLNGEREVEVEITDEAGNPTPIIPANKAGRKKGKRSTRQMTHGDYHAFTEHAK